MVSNARRIRNQLVDQRKYRARGGCQQQSRAVASAVLFHIGGDWALCEHIPGAVKKNKFVTSRLQSTLFQIKFGKYFSL